MEFKVEVPGNYILVDHAIARVEKSAVGIIVVEGPEAPDTYRKLK